MWIQALAVLLATVTAAGQSSRPSNPMSLREYQGELDRLLRATRTLNQDPEGATRLAQSLPLAWHIQEKQQSFEIPTDWLKDELAQAAKKQDNKLAATIQSQLQQMGSESEGFDMPAANPSASRALLAQILTRREFHNLHGPTWWDLLKQRIQNWLFHILERIFGSSAVPAISRIVVYSLIGVAVLAVAIWIYRWLKRSAEAELSFSESLPISAKDWKLWFDEAMKAAERSNWRDAIRLAYWAGISFLEAAGAWHPDVARTPREYLRLLPAASEYRGALSGLTRSFELIWYGNREADAEAFSQTVSQLERLGCRQT